MSRWPWVLGGLFAVVVVVGIYGYALYGSAMGMRSTAQDAMSHLTSYVEAANSGDVDKLQSVASAASATAHELQDELSSPLWTAAQVIPVAGSDVRSVRVMGDVLVDVTDNVLAPLAEGSGALSLSTLMQNGEVNIEALRNLLDAVEEVRPVISRSSEAVKELPQANIKQVGAVLEPVRESVTGVSSAFDRLSPMIPYLPDLFGADGQTKTYMVLAENTAEVHAAGGWVGWIGYLVATDGHIELRDFQGLTRVLNSYELSVGATEEEIDLFDRVIDLHTGDHTMTPDFYRTGQMYYKQSAMQRNEDIDGVIAVDPVFVQYMLGLVGGIDTSFGVKVDGSNAASVMLNQCLFWWSSTECDDFYEEVSNTAFHKVLDNLGSVDTLDFFSKLAQSAEEEHCKVWVKDESVESAIQEAGFGGELSHDITRPVTGVFFNDRSTSKAAYYLSTDVQVGVATKGEDGSTVYPVQLQIKNNMSRTLLNDALPGYLRVQRTDCRSFGDLYEDTFLIAPEGGSIEVVSVSRLNSTIAAANETVFTEKSYQGLQVFKTGLRLDADEIVTVSYKVTCPPEATEPLKVRVTPLVPEEIAHW